MLLSVIGLLDWGYARKQFFLVSWNRYDFTLAGYENGKSVTDPALVTRQTRGSLAKQSDCFCMAKTKRPKRKMVLAAYNRKKILPRYPVNLKLHRKKNWKI